MTPVDADSTGIQIAWYGDDFTGASAVMEILTFAGLPAVLFLKPPTEDMLERYAGYRAFGIAGLARSKSPRWMEESLPSIFERLVATGAALVHYKICSTFDSSPQTGSIGRAIEVGAGIVGGQWFPLLAAAPPIGRYQVFGNLFAGDGETVHRLDRHPTMSRHPVTPMREADIRAHLAEQTRMPIGLVDVIALQHSHTADEELARQSDGGAKIIAFDACDPADMRAAGRLIWENRKAAPFVVGSQGVEYALVSHWCTTGGLSSDISAPRAEARDRIAVVSGSVSPVAARQIAWAGENGFELARFDPASVADEGSLKKELDDVTAASLRAADAGRSPLVYTALGPDDPTVGRFRDVMAQAQIEPGEANERIGNALGRVLETVLTKTGIGRVAISGGDTSGHAARQLRIEALTALAPVTPGGGLCLAHRSANSRETFEIAFKGGQMGPPDYFGQIRNGGDAKTLGRTSR